MLHVDEKPAKPIYKRWQFWVGLGAGVAAAGAAAITAGVLTHKDYIAIPVDNTPALTAR